MIRALPGASTAAACLALATSAAAPAGKGDPARELPPHITRLTSFGERPDWRHDGRRILFLNRTFGDVYEYEIATGRIFPCTDHFTHNGFVRALYLSNGDLLLSGPVDAFDRTNKAARQRARDACRLSVLDRKLDSHPVPLDVQCNEGPAVGRTRLRIAWTHGEQDRISVGEISYADGRPRIVDSKQVLAAKDFPAAQRPRKWIETQNFVPPDDANLTVTAYELNDSTNTDTFLLDLATGDLRNLSNTKARYEECEGVFPDGKSTLVESAEIDSRWPLVDLYKLALDGSGRKERLTFFADYPGWKAAEGVVSDDGKYIAFQNGKSGQEAGVGFGLFLYDLEKSPRRK